MPSIRLLFFVMLITMNAMSQKNPTFDIQGHRGARGLMPENTIPAFILALDSGVTTIELDLAVTSDKRIVVSHEPWMAASICLDSSGNEIPEKEEMTHNIFKMTYEQVSRFDCGSKINERFPQQAKIKATKPLLEDVIVAVEDRIKSKTLFEVDYNIEIKSSPKGDNVFHPTPEVFSDMVYQLLNEYLPMERIVIQSFDFRVLKYWHKKYPRVRLAALVEDQKPVSSHLDQLGFQPNIYSPYYKLLTNEKVDYLHERKIKVIPWTVNEINEMMALKGMGVDGLITDYPDRAAQFWHTLNIVPKKP
ncbi:MAG: glycerophosphodiester phosphodiesterase family protein [Cyclobacteriaceae bacterium]